MQRWQAAHDIISHTGCWQQPHNRLRYMQTRLAFNCSRLTAHRLGSVRYKQGDALWESVCNRTHVRTTDTGSPSACYAWKTCVLACPVRYWNPFRRLGTNMKICCGGSILYADWDRELLSWSCRIQDNGRRRAPTHVRRCCCIVAFLSLGLSARVRVHLTDSARHSITRNFRKAEITVKLLTSLRHWILSILLTDWTFLGEKLNYFLLFHKRHRRQLQYMQV